MIKTLPEIREKLRSMNESELRKILVLIFESLGLQEVTESHGTQEFGKDIVFYDLDKFGRQVWTACVVKTKDINQTAFDTVIRQVGECFRKRYPSISQGNVDIDQVFVITNGSYKDNAKSQIADILDVKKPITFWNDTEIAKNIERNGGLLDILFGSHDLVKNLFNEQVGKNLGNDVGIKLLESDFDVHINSVEGFYIKVRAKAKQFEEERGEYLKAIDAHFKNIPTKFLPEIDGILSGKKFLLLHGIATSGKSTTLKKLEGTSLLINMTE
jgi:hypothetical protein